MKTNERWNLNRAPPQTSKNPTISLSLQNPQNSTQPYKPNKETLLPTRQVEKRFLDHSTNIYVTSNHNAKQPKESPKLNLQTHNAKEYSLGLSSPYDREYNRKDQQKRATSS